MLDDVLKTLKDWPFNHKWPAGNSYPHFNDLLEWLFTRGLILCETVDGHISGQLLERLAKDYDKQHFIHSILCDRLSLIDFWETDLYIRPMGCAKVVIGDSGLSPAAQDFLLKYELAYTFKSRLIARDMAALCEINGLAIRFEPYSDVTPLECMKASFSVACLDLSQELYGDIRYFESAELHPLVSGPYVYGQLKEQLVKRLYLTETAAKELFKIFVEESFTGTSYANGFLAEELQVRLKHQPELVVTCLKSTRWYYMVAALNLIRQSRIYDGIIAQPNCLWQYLSSKDTKVAKAAFELMLEVAKVQNVWSAADIDKWMTDADPDFREHVKDRLDPLHFTTKKPQK